MKNTKVLLRGTQLGSGAFAFESTTDERGELRIRQLPFGEYNVELTSSGESLKCTVPITWSDDVAEPLRLVLTNE